jgi:hypothetical protein
MSNTILLFYAVCSYILDGMIYSGHNARGRQDGKEKSSTVKSCIGTGSTQLVEGGLASHHHIK